MSSEKTFRRYVHDALFSSRESVRLHELLTDFFELSRGLPPAFFVRERRRCGETVDPPNLEAASLAFVQEFPFGAERGAALLENGLIQGIVQQLTLTDEGIHALKQRGKSAIDAGRGNTFFDNIESLNGLLGDDKIRRRILRLVKGWQRTTPDQLPETITLSQASGLLRKSKKSLQSLKSRGRLPDPDFPAKRPGQVNLWRWETIKPALEEIKGVPLPDRMPSIHGYMKLPEKI